MTQDMIRKEVLSTASNLHQSEGLGSYIDSYILLVYYIESGDAKFIITLYTNNSQHWAIQINWENSYFDGWMLVFQLDFIGF